jgi:hypothetical protein
MKALITGLFLSLIVFTINAQKSPIKFGEIPMEDMKMTVYDLDSSASAVILADYGEAYLNATINNTTINFERHIRIKILNKDGLDWANGNIRLYNNDSDEEKVTNLKASTYNLENGKIVETKMAKDAAFKEKFNRNFSFQKFTLPNVKEGSVIEYSYKVISDFYWLFPNWQFQERIPTRLSEFWALQPNFFIYERYMTGYIQISDYEIKSKSIGEYTANAHHWTVRDIPAFKEEPYMTCEEDYISKINFALSHIDFPGQPTKEIMGSWNTLTKTLLESEAFGAAIRGNNFLKKQVEEITTGLTDPMAKVQAIHSYVKNNIAWNDEKHYTAGNFKKILELKKGTSGDINLLMACMLEKADIPVDMVMLSTRDHGFIREQYPMERQFNYTVCLVRLDGKSIWLDATNPYLQVNMLPQHCLNGQGLLVSKINFGWVKLESKIKAKTIVSADLAFDGESLKGKLNFIHDGYDAQRMRSSYFSKGKETYLKDKFSDKSWKVENSDFQNLSEVDKAVKEIHEIEIEDHAMVTGDVVYINPFITSQMESNPFTSEARTYPVDFGSLREKMYMMKLTVPDGYQFDEVPKSKMIMLPNNTAKFAYNVVQNGNSVTITSNFQINQNLFAQTEYVNLREFYSLMIAKQTEQIVLKKK